MVSVIDLFCGAVGSLGYPIIRQGTLPDDEAYPTHFYTFANTASDGSGYYDNVDTRTNWRFIFAAYSVDPGKVEEMIMLAKGALRKKGFLVSGKGYDVASDEVTHTGRGMQALYIEQE